MAALGLTFTARAAVLFRPRLVRRRDRPGGSRRPRAPISLWLDRIAGTIFVGLGLRLIVTR